MGMMNSYAGFLQPLLLFGMLTAVVRHYYELKDHPEEFRSYFSTCFFFLLGFVGLIIGVLLIVGPSLWSPSISGGVPYLPYVPLMLGTVFFTVLGMMFQWLNKAQMLALRFTMFDGGGFVVSTVLGLTLVIGLRWGAEGVLTGNLTSAALCTILLARTAKPLFTRRLQFRYLVQALAFGLPFVPHLLSGWAMNLADRVIIGNYVSVKAVGLYNLAFNLAVVVNMLITSINEAWTPKFYDLMNQGGEEVDRKVLAFTSIWFFVVGSVACGFALFGDEVVRGMAPSHYHEAGRFVAPLAVGFFFHGIYFLSVQPLFYAKRTKLIASITVSSASLTLFVNWLAIPRFGVMAAAYVSLFGNALTGLVCFFFSNRVRRFAYPLRRYVGIIGMLFGAMLLEGRLVNRGWWGSAMDLVIMIGFVTASISVLGFKNISTFFSSLCTQASLPRLYGYFRHLKNS